MSSKTIRRTSVVNDHSHTYDDSESGFTSVNNNHSHEYIVSDNNKVRILRADGHTHEPAAANKEINMSRMTKDYLTVPFEIKQIEEDEEFFTFEGYASTFGNVDLGDDIVQRGAFQETLQDRMPKLLWQHRMNEPIGIFVAAFEDERGLFVKGKMPIKDSFVQGRVIPQMKIGSVDSMSIGFSIVDMEFDKEIRTIQKVDLFEISLVTLPMNPKATVTGMKAVVPFQDLPLAESDLAWDSAAAVRRVRDFTGSEDQASSSYKRAFLWYDKENGELFGSYKLPIADVIDGRLKAVPRGIFAAAGAMRGARGGVNIPEADRAGVIKNINKYYDKMGLESPFEKSIEEEIEDLKTPKDINNYLKFYGFSKIQTEGVMARMREVIKQGKPDDQSKSDQDLINLIKANTSSIKDITNNIKGE